MCLTKRYACSGDSELAPPPSADGVAPTTPLGGLGACARRRWGKGIGLHLSPPPYPRPREQTKRSGSRRMMRLRCRLLPRRTLGGSGRIWEGCRHRRLRLVRRGWGDPRETAAPLQQRRHLHYGSPILQRSKLRRDQGGVLHLQIWSVVRLEEGLWRSSSEIWWRICCRAQGGRRRGGRRRS
jgi:hypothetical protein